VPRVEIGDDVIENLPLASVRERHVNRRGRRDARIRIVDVTAGEDQVRPWMTTPKPMHKRPDFSVCLRGDGAAVDDADIRRIAFVGDGEPGASQPVTELRHLGEIHLASQRLDGDPHD